MDLNFYSAAIMLVIILGGGVMFGGLAILGMEAGSKL